MEGVTFLGMYSTVQTTQPPSLLCKRLISRDTGGNVNRMENHGVSYLFPECVVLLDTHHPCGSTPSAVQRHVGEHSSMCALPCHLVYAMLSPCDRRNRPMTCPSALQTSIHLYSPLTPTAPASAYQHPLRGGPLPSFRYSAPMATRTIVS